MVFDRAEILDMADQLSTSKQASRMMRTASVSEGTRKYLCNLFAGTAAAAQGWAWQTALAIAKVHAGVRALVMAGQIAFWAFIGTNC
ncbi:hypothetical protein CPHO_00885 [Corynebacterium phocae]|uniref:Uncharacterized protein n=1 Tax=Corynebacterium phocae TaxID=161895 RepID=A0A1L7D0W3_9CORY|nr:hypothetical protein CPHO_00885 [Corynebacterium phocae]